MGLASTITYKFLIALASDCGLSIEMVTGTCAPLSARLGPVILMKSASSIVRLVKKASLTTGQSCSEGSAYDLALKANNIPVDIIILISKFLLIIIFSPSYYLLMSKLSI